MKPKLSSILGLLAILGGVSTTAKDRKIPIPDPTRGAIGVTIRFKGPTPLSLPTHANEAFFVRVEDVDAPGLPSKALVGRFSEGNQVYLLNAEPGKYVAVAAFAPARGKLPPISLYFDKEMIQATAVTVEAGRIAFMGQIVAKVGISRKSFDEVSTQYRDLIGGGRYNGSPGTLQSLDRDSKTANEFLKRAVNDAFKDQPDWQELVRRQLALR